MSNPYVGICQDFYINARLCSQLSLPHNREAVLHFFERLQREFPGLAKFRKTENGELSLEEDRESGSYRWVTLENKKLSSGHVNPPSIEEALRLHCKVLEQAPYQLGISSLEIDHLDVLFGFDLEFQGNHDEIIAESLFPDSPMASLLEEDGVKAVDFQPTFTVALSEDMRLKARIDVITRTNTYQVRTGEYGDDAISVYLNLRRSWSDHPKTPLHEMMKELAERAEDLCSRYVVPKIVRPISTAIASRS